MKTQNYELKELCLEITDICPLNCRHCSGMCDLNAKNMISFSQIKRIINDFAILGGRVLEISGGEPLLHPDLLQIVYHAKKSGLETILYTSGNMLDINGQKKPLTTKIVSKLQKMGLDKVVFSLQGATPVTHEAITQVKGSFDNALCSIERMRKTGFWIGVHFVPMKINFHEFLDFCEMAEDLHINEIGVLRFVPQGRGFKNKQDLQLGKSDFAEFTNLINELTSNWKEAKIRVGRPIDFRFIFNSSEDKTECDAGKSRCLISPDGKVKPCPAFKNGNDKYVAGNIKNKSLTKIWNEPANWDDLRSFDYNRIQEPCNNCNLLQKCRGGCIAQRLLRYNDPTIGPDPCCFKCFKPKEMENPAEAKIREQVPEQLLSVQI